LAGERRFDPRTKSNFEEIVAMSLTQILRAQRNIALACCILFLLVAPLHAQFSYRDLYDFNCQTGGCYPQNVGTLVQIGDGSFDGATKDGASGNVGTLFQVTTSPPVAYIDFLDFASSYGTNPGGAVVFDTYGNLYATTTGGGANGNGTLIVMFLGSPLDLHDFTVAEGFPVAPPVLGKDGNLYGFTTNGAAYTVTIPSPTYHSLGTYAPGSVYAPLLLAADGYLYGTSDNGGKNNLGTVFRMTSPSGAIKTIFNFNGKNGNYVYSPLVQDSAGNFYGTTFNGGANDTGVIFKLTPKGAYTRLRDFDASGCNNSGANPGAGLAFGTDGNLYGVATNGGANCAGTIFQISTSGSGFSKLVDFTGMGGSAPGANPYAGLALNTNGTFYGLTIDGGANEDGVYFSLTPVNFRQILAVEGPIFVLPGGPVEIFGNNLTQTYQVNFGGAQAQFQVSSDTSMSATVPMDAVDGVIVDTLQTGLQIQTLSAMHILPLITNLDPPSGPVGTQVGIVGGGFAGATKVTFGGVKATNFTVVSPSLIQAIVPRGAKTGKVVVTTPNGTAASPEKFTVN
jgi:uncharacterized repeat protein (TIGR03803 family)